MSEKKQILEFIEERSREGRTVSYLTLVRQCDLTPETACDYLKRLWRERLVECADRPPRFHFRLEPGESIRDLRFELSERGRERLKWHRKCEREEEEEGWFS
jgi:DNA-binding IclR family transcriptional regulator